MITIELSEKELNDLAIFLNRTNLTGSEVPAFLAIMTKLAAAKQNQ